MISVAIWVFVVCVGVVATMILVWAFKEGDNQKAQRWQEGRKRMKDWKKSLFFAVAIMVVPFLYFQVQYWLYGPQMILPAHDYVSHGAFVDEFLWKNTDPLYGLLGLAISVLVLWGLVHDYGIKSPEWGQEY